MKLVIQNIKQMLIVIDFNLISLFLVTASLVVQELIPDNDYILYCYGSSEIGELSIFHSKTMQSFHTLPGSFQFYSFINRHFCNY